jgi:16S rRNA (uracil1498-N3)-methyltransferase
MRLHRFFIELSAPLAGSLEITDRDLLHQWSRVLRYTGGEEVCLLDGKGREVLARLLTCSAQSAKLLILSEKHETVSVGTKLTLCFSPLKREHTEWVFQKGTELGVAVFQPIDCERTVKDGVNLARAERIIREATEQSGRLWLPEVREIKSFSQVLKEADPKQAVFASLIDSSDRSHERFSNHGMPSLSLFIGPEGGWTEDEERLASEQGVRRIRLSQHILRAETACLAGVALLLV